MPIHVSDSDPARIPTELLDTTLWSALNAYEQERVFAKAEMLASRKGTVVIAEGMQAHALFIVIEGALRLTRINGRGHRIVAGFLFRGDVVGACIPDRYPFSVEAIEPAVLCQIERQTIRDVNAQSPGLEWRIITEASSEFLQCQTHLDVVLGGSVEAKLARFLLHIGGRIGEPDAVGTTLELPMSREDIAHYLGHSLETVSRAFTKLREHGALATPHRTHLITTDDKRLAEIAENDH